MKNNTLHITLKTLLITCSLTLLTGWAGGVRAGNDSMGVSGEIVSRHVIDCFDKGLTTHEGKPVYCELSAVVFDHSRLYLASDKPVPGEKLSAVFTVPYSGHGPIEEKLSYLTAAPFVSAIKYEDMTLTPDGEYIIATTGFDRVKSDTSEWDAYNTLLVWPAGELNKVKVVAATTADGVTSSVSLREKISHSLVLPEFPDGVPYFKVESLAAIPGGQLLFGIRELGMRYDQFAYSFKIITVSYQIEAGELSFTSDFELIYDFDTDSQPESRQTMALSSIEYDPFHDQLYMLTSYENEETDEGLGGYLWTLPMADLHSGKSPSLVMKKTGGALLFAHKAEGLTVLGESSVLVFHDDDRVLGREVIENPETQFYREAHQAAYSLVSLQNQVVHSTGRIDRPELPAYTRLLMLGGLLILLWLGVSVIRRQSMRRRATVP